MGFYLTDNHINCKGDRTDLVAAAQRLMLPRLQKSPWIKLKGMKKHYAVFLFLLAARLAMAGNSYECAYLADNGKDLVTEKNCLTYLENARPKATGGDALISKKVAARASYDENGLAFLYSPVGVFYFTRAGLVRKTLNYDNGPDYFSDGLARMERNGQIGFFDKNLSVVIAPQYDFAFPFKNGLSIVCMRCARIKDGEHTRIAGGKWGAINKKGEIIQPLVHSEAELKALLK